MGRKKADAADRWLESLTPKASPPRAVFSLTRVALETGTVIAVWRRKAEVWGDFSVEDQEVVDKIKEVHPAYGREIVEAVCGLPGVVRVEITRPGMEGSGVVVLCGEGIA